MPWLWVNYDGGIIYEANADFTRNYVNGNPINISYSYQDTISNSAGSQFYDISIDTSLDYKVAYDVIDIVFFNYFYDHNPFGVNSITYTTSYRLENIRGEKK